MDALRMNIPPNETDVIQAIKFLDVEERELRRYDQEISEHASQANVTLHEERALLERRIQERRSWLSPIRKLPFEILVDIISYASVTSRGYSLEIPQDKFGSPIEAPICLLSHVSFWWRTVALNLPQLWASLSVDVSLASAKHYTLVELFIQRSQDLTSLKLDIVAHPKFKHMPLRHQHEEVFSLGQTGCDLLALLMQLLPRCNELCLSTKRNCFPLTVDVPGLALPFLTSFVDRTWGHSANSSAHSFWAAIQRAPNLEHLEVIYYSEDVPYPYGQIRSLVVRLPSIWSALQRPTSWLRAIGSCVRLESLTLLRYTQCQGWAADPIQVELPILRHFALKCNDSPKTLDFLLSCLTFPSLVSFDCRHSFTQGSMRWVWSTTESTASIRFLEQCSDTLQSLRLHAKFYMLSTELLTMVLRAIPNLTSVQLEFTAPQDQGSSTISRLCTRMCLDATLVPRLQALSVREWMTARQLEDLNPEEVIAMLEAKCRTRSSLADVSIFFCEDHNDDRDETGLGTTPSLTPELLDRLQHLRNKGMDCNIAIL
ncbi:hypothetical protein VNI00_004626 [Paramarasmius palmivorus]|uniref:F-box domain-containing protein n=1 Tax=Paramarasmius palmivorus TaxID=297713 RepID=A0AAW0DLR9_9AGAR